MNEFCYIITSADDKGADVYSIKRDGKSHVLVFENGDDAERYVIMLEQDDDYIVGESFALEAYEVPTEAVMEALTTKGYAYIYVKPDDLYIPPPTS